MVPLENVERLQCPANEVRAHKPNSTTLVNPPLFRAARRQVVPRVRAANPRYDLTNRLGHELLLILVDVVAAVLRQEEACIGDEPRHLLVRGTQDRFQRIR
jgi:hypothetical protein